jgi:hypothetical protein
VPFLAILIINGGELSLAGGWFDKIVNFLGYSDQEEELESFEEVYEDEPRRRARAPVLSLHSSPEVKIIVVTPGSFDEVENVANHLKSRKPVVVNLSVTTKEVGQRILDFLAGTENFLHILACPPVIQSCPFFSQFVLIPFNCCKPSLQRTLCIGSVLPVECPGRSLTVP